jgi:hypothetical protein
MAYHLEEGFKRKKKGCQTKLEMSYCYQSRNVLLGQFGLGGGGNGRSP